MLRIEQYIDQVEIRPTENGWIVETFREIETGREVKEYTFTDWAELSEFLQRHMTPHHFRQSGEPQIT